MECSGAGMLISHIGKRKRAEGHAKKRARPASDGRLAVSCTGNAVAASDSDPNSP